MLDYNEMNDWIQVCEVKENELCFTSAFIEATKLLGGARRKFVASLIGSLDGTTSTVLDYFGPHEAEKDWYDGIDGHAMDINEDIPEHLEYKGQPTNGLSAKWFRDLMRVKLVNLKLPPKPIKEYVKLWEERLKG